MNETPTRKVRATWTHTQIAELSREFHKVGLDVLKINGAHSFEETKAKLIELGLIALSAGARKTVETFCDAIAKLPDVYEAMDRTSYVLAPEKIETLQKIIVAKKLAA